MTFLASQLSSAAAGEAAKNSKTYSVFGLKHTTHASNTNAASGLSFAHDLLLLGVVFNYAATASDTLSSELGILSPSPPRLILSGKVCSPGTNGGVTFFGLLSGAAGAALIALTALASGIPWHIAASTPAGFVGYVTLLGVAGSILDSVLGALFQETVVDTRTGKVVEAPGGGKVLVIPGQRKGSFKGEKRTQIGYAPENEAVEVEATEMSGSEVKRRHKVEDREEVDIDEKVGRRGRSRVVAAGVWGGLLDNNMVNLSMAVAVSVAGMLGVAGAARVVGAVVLAVREVMKSLV